MAEYEFTEEEWDVIGDAVYDQLAPEQQEALAVIDEVSEYFGLDLNRTAALAMRARDFDELVQLADADSSGDYTPAEMDAILAALDEFDEASETEGAEPEPEAVEPAQAKNRARASDFDEAVDSLARDVNARGAMRDAAEAERGWLEDTGEIPEPPSSIRDATDELTFEMGDAARQRRAEAA